MARATYTEAQLRHAWACARRRTWPPTFEEAMQDPARSRLVRIAAMRIARGGRLAPPPVAPTARPLPLHLDRKRIAAGERDDD